MDVSHNFKNIFLMYKKYFIVTILYKFFAILLIFMVSMLGLGYF